MTGSVIKSELLAYRSLEALNIRLQQVINEYNALGLLVRIEKVYSESARMGSYAGNNNTLYDYVLVVGYERGELGE